MLSRNEFMNDIPTSPTDILQRIFEAAKTAMPDSLSDDMKENLRTAIQGIISDLDVVTREEFDVQKNVLAKTRTRIEEMEAMIAELEKTLAG